MCLLWRVSPFVWGGGSGHIEEILRCFYQEADGIHYLFLPSYCDMGSIVVSFQGAELWRCDDGEYLIEMKSGTHLSELREDAVYTCSFLEDGVEQQTMKLCILHSQNLPAVFIETESGSMERIDADKKYQEAGTFVLIDADGTVECIDDLKHITGRGNDTWTKPKKSYGIKLSAAANLLDMGAADHWVLLSNVVDQIYLRNKITYDMAIAAGMEGAPESEFVDLYLNGQYHGLYQLSEKVEIDAQRIPIRDLELENIKINKDYETAERFGDDTFKGVALGEIPLDITGGYLIERDVIDKHTEETSGFQSPVSGDYYTIKSPECAVEAEVAYIQNLFSEMETAVRAPDGINPDTGKSYLDYIDLESFAKKYIIEECSENNGGGATSSFFYKPSDSVSDKIFAGPVWDYDKAYGICDDYNANPRCLLYMTQRPEGTTLFRELCRHREFQDKVKDYYKEFFSDYLEEISERQINNCYMQIASAVRLDRIRWTTHVNSYMNWDEENRNRFYYLRDFVRERKKFLDQVWVEGQEICVVTFLDRANQIATSMGVIRGECLIPVPEDNFWWMPADQELEGWYDVETGEKFDEEEPVLRDMELAARFRPKKEENENP